MAHFSHLLLEKKKKLPLWEPPFNLYVFLFFHCTFLHRKTFINLWLTNLKFVDEDPYVLLSNNIQLIDI